MNNLVIGLTGPKHVGKSTTARALTDTFGFVELAFADPLKEAICGLLDQSVDDWDTIKEEPIDPLHPDLQHVTPRNLATLIGTDTIRQHVSENFWIWVLTRRAERLRGQGAPLVISDIRYDNEARAVRKMGGKVIRLDRENITYDTLHDSEKGISATYVDQRIWIDSTPDKTALALLQAVTVAGDGFPAAVRT